MKKEKCLDISQGLSDYIFKTFVYLLNYGRHYNQGYIIVVNKRLYIFSQVNKQNDIIMNNQTRKFMN